MSNNTLPDLSGYYGSDTFTRFSPLHKCVLTDGCQRVAEDCSAYWLFDLAASHLIKHDDYFAKCRLSPAWGDSDNAVVVELDDGNGNVFARQHVQSTDFPKAEFTFFCGRYGEGSDQWTMLLPSEY